MEKILSTLQSRKKAPVRLTRNSVLFKTVIRAIQEKKGEAIVSLDLKKIDEAVADYFVLCEADNPVQVRAIAMHVVEEVAATVGERPFHKEMGEHWTLVDFVNIVVHVFLKDQRRFYDLESLWMDAGRMEHGE